MGRQEAAEPLPAQIIVDRDCDFRVARWDGAVKQGLPHPDDAVGTDRAEKNRVIPIDALYIGGDLRVRCLPKEPETAVISVEAKKMGLDRPPIVPKETADPRPERISPSRQRIDREDPVILYIVKFRT
jgi:hypothetical protein